MKKLKILSLLFFMLITVIFTQASPLRVNFYKNQIIKDITQLDNQFKVTIEDDGETSILEILNEEMIVIYRFNKENLCYMQVTFYPNKYLQPVKDQLYNMLYLNEGLYINTRTNIIYELIANKDRDYFTITNYERK